MGLQNLRICINGLIPLEMTSAFPHQTLLDFFQGFYLNSLLPLPEKDMSDCTLSLLCETGREGKRTFAILKSYFTPNRLDFKEKVYFMNN